MFILSRIKIITSNTRLHEVGEDLLVDISEVLFNELAYYQLLKDQGYVPSN